MGDTLVKHQVHGKKDEYMTSAADDLNEISKALTARIAGGIANRARMDARVSAYNEAQTAFKTQLASEVPVNVGIAQEQPEMGTAREREPAEPPVVPIRAIHNDVSHTTSDAEVFKSCTGCGRMVKSLDACLTCDNKPSTSATPIRFR